MRPPAAPVLSALCLAALLAGCAPEDHAPDPDGAYPALLPLTVILPPEAVPPPSPAAALEAEAADLRARADALRSGSGG